MSLCQNDRTFACRAFSPTTIRTTVEAPPRQCSSGLHRSQKGFKVSHLTNLSQLRPTRTHKHNTAPQRLTSQPPQPASPTQTRPHRSANNQIRPTASLKPEIGSLPIHQHTGPASSTYTQFTHNLSGNQRLPTQSVQQQPQGSAATPLRLKPEPQLPRPTSATGWHSRYSTFDLKILHTGERRHGRT